MKKEENKRFVFNKILVVIAIVIGIFMGFILLLLHFNKIKIETSIKSADSMKQNYITEVSNKWDISEDGDGSIIAVLDANGLLTISGTGYMKNYTIASPRPYDSFSIRSQIKKVKIGEGITNVGSFVFWGCRNLTSVEIPTSVISIDEYSFFDCNSLNSINIPNSVKYIGNGAFQNCISLKSIDIPDSVKSIGSFVFGNCNRLISVKISSNITNIPMCAFENCNRLISVEIPAGVQSIESNAFNGCRSLTSITIPSSVTEIEWGVFEECYDLTIYCYEGSYAEIYANQNEIPYKLISTSTKPKIDEINLIITEIQPQTTIEKLRATLEIDMTYEITDKDGNKIENISEIIETGYRINLENGKKYTLIVKGDCNGDGSTDIKDIFAINSYRLNKNKLTDEFLYAADVTGDENVDIKDIFQINKFRLKIIKEL